MPYKNYIFDLYGTLIDIHTDEENEKLWDFMAELYAIYGADYTGGELKEAYLGMVDEEERRLRGKAEKEKKDAAKNKNAALDSARPLAARFPEIDLGRVFARLYLEAPRTHSAAARPLGESLKKLKKQSDEEALIARLLPSEWMVLMAGAFRTFSRDKFELYPGTLTVLDQLKAKGCGIYLLSNAQSLFTVPELEMTGLLPYFDGIYISSERAIRKPNPDFMRMLLKNEKLDPKKCVMVGNDCDTDIAVARAAGVDSIFVNTYQKTVVEVWDAIESIENMNYTDHAKISCIMDGDIAGLLTGAARSMEDEE